MATGIQVIQIYKECSNRKRLDLLCENYSCIKKIIKADVHGLAYIVLEDREVQRREEMGDLGVRVKGSGLPGNPVGNYVEAQSVVEEAIANCDFSSGILKGTDHEIFVMERAEVHKLILRDLDKLDSQLDCLEEEEKNFFLPYINKRKCIDDIADELGISYQSTLRRITRIKDRINQGMHPLDYEKK